MYARWVELDGVRWAADAEVRGRRGLVEVVWLMERGGRQMQGAITRRGRTRAFATRGTRGATLTMGRAWTWTSAVRGRTAVRWVKCLVSVV